jgi:hypothetical protein
VSSTALTLVVLPALYRLFAGHGVTTTREPGPAAHAE